MVADGEDEIKHGEAWRRLARFAPPRLNLTV
jgi:hypothetical protein